MKGLSHMSALALVACALGAQAGVAQEPRLERRLDPGTRSAVMVIVDSARLAGLPTEPLVDRALEGASKHADPSRILAAVRLLADELRSARSALGMSSSTAELEAGASALRAGVRTKDLTVLRRSRSQSLTIALAAMTDLVTSGVPADSASAAVLALAPVARDDQILDFRRAVERDIALGAPPAAAASVRVNAGLHEAAPARKP